MDFDFREEDEGFLDEEEEDLLGDFILDSFDRLNLSERLLPFDM